MKRVNLENGYFIADGRKFYVNEILSIDRYMEFEKLQNSMSFNLTYKEIFKNIKDAYILINSNKLVDGGIKLHNLMSGIAERLETKLNPALEICALFIVEEGEDTAGLDEAVMKSKIDAWRKEGYAMQDFFTLAVSLVEGFKEDYKDFTEAISKVTELTREKNITTE